MSVLVLDASVAVAWCFPDQRNAFTLRILDEVAAGFGVVPDLWTLEVSNALVVAERKGWLTAEQSSLFLRELGSLPLEIEAVSGARAFGRILGLARAHRLTAYDACYLELADRMGLPLATEDDTLRRAARSEGVALVSAS